MHVLPNITAFLNGHQTHISDEPVAFSLDHDVGVILRCDLEMGVALWSCRGCFLWVGGGSCQGMVPAARII